MKILVCQMNPIIGDLSGNTDKVIEAIERGKKEHCSLVLFPELALSGYPPQDLLLSPHFIHQIERYAEKVREATSGITVFLGLPTNSKQKRLHNSCAVYQNKEVVGYYHKQYLPTYDVFNEARYFTPGNQPFTLPVGGKVVGITICEDIWEEIEYPKVDLLINISASPFYLGKRKIREQIAANAAKKAKAPLILCNQVGANDQLIFDGCSLFVNAEGEKLVELPGFVEEMRLIDLEHLPSPSEETVDLRQELFSALSLGLRDYCHKLGFKKVLLGLSGGIDSSLVAAIAVESLGAENVLGVLMPSRFTLDISNKDALDLARNLGIETLTLPIEKPHQAFLEVLEEPFKHYKPDITEENIQSRIRGTLLMALSNKTGALLLTTGNKSEVALGYCTLYGDMCGALSVIGDLTKGEVYSLSKWINREREIIPKSSLEREPTAELRADQRDVDTLPPYPIVDRVVEGYVEEHKSATQIAKEEGFELPLVEKLIQMIHRNEYKRYQAAPILKVSEKTFSAGRHFPIVEKSV